MSDQGWRVLHVVANHEKRVAQHLRLRSLDHYLPLYQEVSRWSDRSVRLERPLFPGYVFARFHGDQKHLALAIPGVVSLLGNEVTGCVPASELDRIRTALAAHCPLRPHPPVLRGSRVRVRTGIFAGVEGMVAEIRHECNVVLALPPLDRLFSLQCDITDIEVLEAASVA